MNMNINLTQTFNSAAVHSLCLNSFAKGRATILLLLLRMIAASSEKNKGLNIDLHTLSAGALQTHIYMLPCFADTLGQSHKHVEQPELWTAPSCVGAVVGP